jgi:hypothetical protein
MYLDPLACNWVEHGLVHYWEQGQGGKGLISSLAPGSYAALKMMFQETKRFRDENVGKHPNWFRAGAVPLDFDLVVGTDAKPGILYNVTAIVEADKRFEEWIRALKKLDLPPLPGFESMCKEKGATTTSSPPRRVRRHQSAMMTGSSDDEEYDGTMMNEVRGDDDDEL